MGCWLGGRRVPIIVSADDIGLQADTKQDLEILLHIVCDAGALFNMKLCVKKSKVMRLSKKKQPLVLLNPLPLETVLSFKYLGVGI